MSLLEAAIVFLENEITQLRSLTDTTHPGTDIYWWALQAKSLGLSHLRSLQASGVTDPLQADQVRKLYRSELQPAVLAVKLEDSRAPS